MKTDKQILEERFKGFVFEDSHVFSGNTILEFMTEARQAQDVESRKQLFSFIKKVKKIWGDTIDTLDACGLGANALDKIYEEAEKLENQLKSSHEDKNHSAGKGKSHRKLGKNTDTKEYEPTNAESIGSDNDTSELAPRHTHCKICSREQMHKWSDPNCEYHSYRDCPTNCLCKKGD